MAIDGSDLKGKLYLVARIYRIGALRDQSKRNKKKVNEYRRPFGCAAFSLSSCAELMDKIGMRF